MLKTPRADPAPRLEIAHRPRRNRKAEWARRLVRENVLTTNDLIWPLFLIEGKRTRVPVAAMPGVERLSVDEAVREAERAVEARHSRDRVLPLHRGQPEGRGRQRGVQRTAISSARRAARSRRNFPSSASITDVALDPYTSHGHDGLMSGERIVNDETRRRAGPAGAQPGARRRRRDRALRHDGRPRRRDPRGARRRRLPRRADPRLRRQIRVRLLWPVPRRDRLGRAR